MKTLFPLLAYFLAAASGLAHAESETANMSGPLRLTETEMDGITAGAVAVGVDASATSISSTQSTYAETNTRTDVVSLPTRQFGIGMGEAYASGGEVNHTTPAFLFGVTATEELLAYAAAHAQLTCQGIPTR